jgi:SCY1-like protein 1
LTIINKLSDRTINGELLRYLAKTSNDEQPGIRTNTTICLGKISKNLGVSTRSKVLIAAFTRSLRDPFVHARNAALMALAATSDVFSEDDCAMRILPAICPSLIDKEKLIRDQANKTLDSYLARVRKHATTMPDSVLPPPTATEASTSAPRMSTPQPSEAASWTGWAISSFTNKISSAAGDIQPSMTPTDSRPSTAQPTRPTASASASALHRQALASPPESSSRTSTSSTTPDYFESGEVGADDGTDAWGDMEDEDFFDASATPSESTATTSKSMPTAKSKPVSVAKPFDDGGEPDFAGWLAAQSAKKSGVAGKALPKGLAKSTPASSGKPGVGRAVTTGSLGTKKAPVSKPAVKKVIDTKPKTAEEDDGWGDGW